MVRRKFPSSGAASSVLYHSNFAAVKTTLPARGQDACRSPQKTFLRRKVFNTSVDKLVEIPCSRTANFSPFNTLLLFAPFVCNIVFSHEHLCGEKSQDRRKKSFAERIQAMKRGQLFWFVFLKRFILNDRPRIFLQYHFCGFSRCTLIVCLGSVMSSQRP